MKTKRTVTSYQICIAAFAAAVNVAGGQLALALRLPVYLDSVGTIFVGALLGPWFGLLPNAVSGIIMGMTTDIYSLYFAPVGMITGFVSGLVFRRFSVRRTGVFLAAAAVTVPGTLVSSLINALLFGGVTSSGSTVLVQLLARTPLGLTGSIFTVQILTDYLDRCISVMAVCALLTAMGSELRGRLRGAWNNGTV